jgi:hypothetical protein
VVNLSVEVDCSHGYIANDQVYVKYNVTGIINMTVTHHENSYHILPLSRQ